MNKAAIHTRIVTTTNVVTAVRNSNERCRGASAASAGSSASGPSVWTSPASLISILLGATAVGVCVDRCRRDTPEAGGDPEPAPRARLARCTPTLSAPMPVLPTGARDHERHLPLGRLRRALRGRQAAQGPRLPPGAGPRAADADQLRRPVVRRRAVGAERSARPLRLLRQDA